MVFWCFSVCDAACGYPRAVLNLEQGLMILLYTATLSDTLYSSECD